MATPFQPATTFNTSSIISDALFSDNLKNSDTSNARFKSNELSESDVAADPERYGRDLKIGDVVEEELENQELGRVSAQAARNIIAQRIKDAEREHVLTEYLSRNNGIIIGASVGT